MGEALTLLAALVSSIAAAVGAAVSVAEYRRSRAPLEGTTTAPTRSRKRETTVPAPPRTRGGSPSDARRSPGSPGRPGEVGTELTRRDRTIRRGVVIATLSCLLAALCQFAYWPQFDEYSYEANSDPWVVFTGLGSLLTSAVGVVYAVRVAVRGMHERRPGNLRVAGLILLGSLIPWVVAALQTLIDARLRG
jgi:hypothetical protein